MTGLATDIARTEPAPLSSVSTGYLPSLDGMRAISIALVVLSHAGLERFVPGGLGVTVFFVVSGFLITRQMIGEVGTTGTLGLRRFFLRRIVRLAPALLVYLALLTPITMALGVPITLPDVLAAVLYIANYWMLFVGFPPDSPFPILWSLAIEEHFYIVFPFVVLLFRRNLRRLLLPLAVAALVALLWRIVLERGCEGGGPVALCGLAGDGAARSRQYLATDTRFDSILFGALLALTVRFHPGMRRYLLGAPPFAAALGMLLLSLLIRDPFFRNTLRYSLQPMALAVVVGNVLFGPIPAVRTPLSSPPLTYLGRLSYSLYLYHWGALVVLARLHGVMQSRAGVPLFLALSLLGAVASYHLVEQPMVRIRRRLGSHTAGQAA